MGVAHGDCFVCARGGKTRRQTALCCERIRRVQTTSRAPHADGASGYGPARAFSDEAPRIIASRARGPFVRRLRVAAACDAESSEAGVVVPGRATTSSPFARLRTRHYPRLEPRLDREPIWRRAPQPHGRVPSFQSDCDLAVLRAMDAAHFHGNRTL